MHFDTLYCTIVTSAFFKVIANYNHITIFNYLTVVKLYICEKVITVWGSCKSGAVAHYPETHYSLLRVTVYTYSLLVL